MMDMRCWSVRPTFEQFIATAQFHVYKAVPTQSVNDPNEPTRGTSLSLFHSARQMSTIVGIAL